MKTLVRIALFSIPVLLAGCDWFEEDPIEIPPAGFDLGGVAGERLTKCA